MDTSLTNYSADIVKLSLLNPVFDRSTPLLGQFALAGSLIVPMIDMYLLRDDAGSSADTGGKAGKLLAARWDEFQRLLGVSFDVWQLAVGRIFPGDTFSVFLNHLQDDSMAHSCLSAVQHLHALAENIDDNEQQAGSNFGEWAFLGGIFSISMIEVMIQLWKTLLRRVVKFHQQSSRRTGTSTVVHNAEHNPQLTTQQPGLLTP